MALGKRSAVSQMPVFVSAVEAIANAPAHTTYDLLRSIASASPPPPPSGRVDNGDDRDAGNAGNARDPHAALERRLEERVRDEGLPLLAALLQHLLQSLFVRRPRPV